MIHRGVRNSGTPGTASGTAEIRAALGNPEVARRTLCRERAKQLPPNPQSHQDLIVQDRWIRTGCNYTKLDTVKLYPRNTLYFGTNYMKIILYNSGLCFLNWGFDWKGFRLSGF